VLFDGGKKKSSVGDNVTIRELLGHRGNRFPKEWGHFLTIEEKFNKGFEKKRIHEFCCLATLISETRIEGDVIGRRGAHKKPVKQKRGWKLMADLKDLEKKKRLDEKKTRRLKCVGKILFGWRPVREKLAEEGEDPAIAVSSDPAVGKKFKETSPRVNSAEVRGKQKKKDTMRPLL